MISEEIKVQESRDFELPMKRKASINSGFAKLWGPTIEVYMTHVKIILGRSREGVSDESFVGIGDSKKISKSHAKIFWDGKAGLFKLENIGKNPIVVNRKEVQPTCTVFLGNNTPIKIGPACFYFILPKPAN